ncbi:PAX3- and PAX7-binding protein 1 [Tachysurus fulvidraco]|uniref:PAX3- and PAX7-binding protein 1 n=1 Tax=Tachysurus fulvidraco TaxID=1234273 RepID=UPI001FEEA670|nr:PAX3- and PAX7-binding protein 1 [Tachysurus fulvidraco]
MFKKAKRCNFRRRNDSDEEEKDEVQDEASVEVLQPCGPAGDSAHTPAVDKLIALHTLNSHGNGVPPGAMKLPKDKKKKKECREEPKASLLSFNDEEDETEVFRVKKSYHSKKIVKQLKKEYREEKSTHVVQEPTRLDGVQSLSGTGVKEEAVDSRGSSEQGEGEMEVDSNEEQDDEGDPRQAGNFSQTLSALSSLRPGEIPDAAFIHAARKRRQMARELGGDAPLVETEVSGKRLVHEDEQGGSDEDEKRIVFSGVKQKSQRQKIAEEIGIECSDDEALNTEGNDEEVSRWEQEQIRKGISIPQVQTSQPSEANVYYQTGYENQQYAASYSMPYGYSALGTESVKPVKVENTVPYPVPSSSLTPVTTALVKKRLMDRLSSMRQGRDASARRYEQIQDELQASENSILQLEDSSQHAAEQYKFLQEMRGYVRDLLECFSEKVPAVLELEAAMHQLLRQRAARRVQRRQDDIKDESAEFSSLSSKAVMAPNLDPFGRDRAAYQELSRQRRVAEREARRARRRQAREQNGARAEHKEGLSSDDEETSTDITSFNLERDRILKESKKVFEDVVDDFHSIDCIKSRFEVWKNLYFTSYRDAYIGQCLPKLFNPLIRLQLIPWSPLEDGNPNFEYMLWFETLLFYGYEEQSTEHQEDIDSGLLPAIVERVVLPKLAVLTEQVWDPLSHSETCRLVSFMLRLIKGYPTILHGDNRNTQELLRTIVVRTRRALDEDIFMPLFPKTVMENKNSSPYLFFQRQFWSCVKLLGNILQWDGILSQNCLKELAVDSTLNRYILSALQSTDIGEDSVEKCKKVVESFPVQWFSSLKGQQTLPQLENLCRYMKHTASSLYRSSLTASDVDKRISREQIKEVVKLLGRLNALDHVIAVASEHGIKDIKTLLESK